MGIGVFMNKRPTTGELFATNQLITPKSTKAMAKSTNDAVIIIRVLEAYDNESSS